MQARAGPLLLVGAAIAGACATAASAGLAACAAGNFAAVCSPRVPSTLCRHGAVLCGEADHGRPRSRRMPHAALAQAPLDAQTSELDADALFGAIEKELGALTPLHEEVAVVVNDGRLAATLAADAAGDPGPLLAPFRALLDELRNRRLAATRPIKSVGPIAGAVVEHRASGREVVILGTPHTVPGLSAKQNPVPRAVRAVIKQLKPALIAVELDKERGSTEMEELPSKYFGRIPVRLPAEELGGGATADDVPRPDAGVLLRLGKIFEGASSSGRKVLLGTREVFSSSRDESLAICVMAIPQMRAENDWGRDATAAVQAAAIAGTPMLLCDMPEEWTLSRVLPVYNKAWVAARGARLEYLKDEARVLEAWDAGDKILKDCVLSGRGGRLPLLQYALMLLAPATGPAEADARPVWLRERDPAMAAAVAAATEGRSRTLAGELLNEPVAKRAVLVVGSAHVEGLVRVFEANHGFSLKSEPRGGWPAPELKADGKGQASRGFASARGGGAARGRRKSRGMR